MDNLHPTFQEILGTAFPRQSTEKFARDMATDAYLEAKRNGMEPKEAADKAEEVYHNIVNREDPDGHRSMDYE